MMPKIQHRRATRETSLAPQRVKLPEAAPTHAASLRYSAPGAIVQRALAAPHSLRPADLMAMQRTLGNRAVGAMLGRAPVQTRLIVSASGDKYECEADRMAEAVMRLPPTPREETLGGQRSLLMRAGPGRPLGGNGSFMVSEEFKHALQERRGRGHPLPRLLRKAFETRFGADFSSLRIHSDAEARQLSHAIQAQAFTRGSDIYLGAGTSVANTTAGERLLAHELAHVVQQGAAPARTETAPPSATEPKADVRPRGFFDRGSVSIQRPAAAGVDAPAVTRIVEPRAEIIIQRKIERGKLNLVGESHNKNDDERAQ
jgi:hypothetical protein